MRPRDILLAIGIAAVWGLNFLALEVGVDRLPPLLFCALRLAAGGLPLLVLRRGPGVPWRFVVVSAASMAVLHFSLMFLGLARGMPAGLTSLVLQSQAVFTMLLAVPLLGERPRGRQIVGIAVAAGGMVVVATGVGGTRPPLAFALILGSAACWGLSNIVVRKAAPPDMLAYLMWVCALGTLPMLAISLAVEGPHADLAALRAFDLPTLGAVAYTSGISTLVGFGLWGTLIKRYGAGTVAPFSMLVPFFGMSSAALLLHETLAVTDIAGGVLVVGGILLGATARTRLRAPIAQPVVSTP
jgi:O-acetylserine/cysteine efflux transporter